MDDYISSLTIADLKARGVESKQQYKNLVRNNCINIPIDLTGPVSIANNYLSNSKIINYSRFVDFPWKFVCTINNVVENGYPFTISDTIYIPYTELNTNIYSKEFIRLLIHERIHIFQRYFHYDVNKFIQSLGYVLYRPINRRSEDYLLRSNPDLDQFIYLYDGIPCGSYYNSPNPKNIDDVSCRLIYEHPYEHMAYKISELLIR